MRKHGIIPGFLALTIALAGCATAPAGVPAIEPTQVSSAKTRHTPGSVSLTTAYTYRAGRKVVELVSPEDEIRRMQSDSQTVEPGLSIDSLEDLGPRLMLPSGWPCRTHALETDSVLKVEGLAWVMQDDFENSSQKMD